MTTYLHPIKLKHMNKAIIRVVDRDVTPNHPQIIYQRLTQYSDVTDLWTQYMMTRMEYPGYHVEVDGGEIQIKSQFTYDEETMNRLDDEASDRCWYIDIYD